MPDAEIIPIGSGGRPGRGTGRNASASARQLTPGGRARPAAAKKAAAKPAAKPAPKSAAGASAASAGRARKAPPPRQTPAESATGAGTGATSSARPATTTQDRSPLAGIPAADWLQALQTGAREIFGEHWEPELARFLAFLRRRLTGDYAVDEFGFDPEVTERLLLATVRPIAQKWFRVETRGLENLPAEGGALVVSNHSGTIPVDGMVTLSVIHDQAGRFLRPLGADLVFRLPLIGQLARATGATLACQEDAERMLRGGELVGVWPEGFKGIGKPFSERYKLQRFGRGGFVSAAIRTGVPIIPLSVVGAEEIYPIVGNIPALARLLGVPYLPITPFFPWLGPLGLVPLPSKWLMEFGEPIRTDVYEPSAADDPMLVFNVSDQVRETIQQTLYSLLMQRGSVWR